jgi:hypothetical protein
MTRRVIDVDWMQKLYDGFVDHHKGLIAGDLLGAKFSPYSSVVDKVFHRAMAGMVWENPVRDAYPNPNHKLAAYYAAIDLLSGAAERGSTDLIERWDAGEIVDIPGFIVTRNNIRHGSDDLFARTVATRRGGRIYFEWGAIPGVRFPEQATALTTSDWIALERAFRTVREFESASYPKRAAKFWALEAEVANNLPKDDELFQLWEREQALGLIRRYFGDRWSAAITTPDERLPKGVSYCRVNGRTDNYILCSMDDAVHHKMISEQDCSIFDLSEKPK